jgi:hypothetical protein
LSLLKENTCPTLVETIPMGQTACFQPSLLSVYYSDVHSGFSGLRL